MNKVCKEAKTDTGKNEDLAVRCKSVKRFAMYMQQVRCRPQEGQVINAREDKGMQYKDLDEFKGECKVQK